MEENVIGLQERLNHIQKSTIKTVHWSLFYHASGWWKSPNNLWSLEICPREPQDLAHIKCHWLFVAQIGRFNSFNGKMLNTCSNQGTKLVSWLIFKCAIFKILKSNPYQSSTHKNYRCTPKNKMSTFFFSKTSNDISFEMKSYIYRYGNCCCLELDPRISSFHLFCGGQ